MFLDIGELSDHKRSGWPLIVHAPQIINAVRSRLNPNPVRKQKVIARKTDIAPRTRIHIIKQDLGFSNDKQDNALPLH